MPETSPPPVPPTAVAPTPGKPYNLSEHAPNISTRGSPELLEALQRRAGQRPERATPDSSPKVIPSQPPRAPIEPKSQPAKPESEPAQSKSADDKPAPHVKFIAADERPVEPPKPSEPDSRVPNEPAPEVIKNAPAQLRDAYERLKADFASRAAEGDLTKKQLAEFQAKAKSYEDRIKTLESADGRAKELEKQVLTLDEQLRVTNYIQHPEFHEKYVRPVSEAMQNAHAFVKELTVEDGSGNVRMGNAEDFAKVLGQPNYALAKAKAKELFGEDFSNEVFQAALKVREAQEKQTAAVKNAALESQNWLKSQQERAAAQRDEARTHFSKVSESMAEKFKEVYRPPENDQDAMAAHQAGKELADIILYGKPEDMPQDKYTENAAKAYHRLASWPMHQLNITRLQAKVDELSKRLSAYEKSTPETGSRQQPGGVQQDAGGVVVTKSGDYEARMRESLQRRAGARR